jgi:glucarate dehydratase
MRITAVRATPLNIPYRRAARMSAGSAESSTRTLIEVETDAGLTGLGDASYAFAAGIIEREFAPALLGMSPFEIPLLKRHCLPDHLDFGTPLLKARFAAWGGLDVALWDLKAQAAGVPVYELLGGAVRESAPFVAYAYAPLCGDSPAEAMSRLALEAIERSGARIFEFKVGVHELDAEIDTVIAVHEALRGKAEVAVDANMALTHDDARRMLQEIGPMLENFEEPVPTLRDMNDLAVEFEVPISAHCCDLDALIPYPRVDAVPTLDACGGISGVRDLARTLGALGRRVWLRSHAESGIGWAAIVHLGMSTAELARPAQSLMDLCAEDLIEGGRFDVRAGGVRAPEIPGLGVGLDRAALAACHALYLEQGEVQAFPPALRRAAKSMPS